MAIDKSKLDVSAIFLTYMALIGDVEKTALAFDLQPADVQELAAQEGWADKIRRVSVMSTSGRPGDFQRAQNRALSFVQAHQIRQLLGKMTQQLMKMEPEDLLAETSVRVKDGGRNISAKVFADLVKAAEGCHRMAYAALGDTTTERLEHTDESGNPIAHSDLHATIIAALNQPMMDDKGTLLQNAQAQIVEEQKAESAERLRQSVTPEQRQDGTA